jgi:DNA-directed RNA polymerase II subunit RPB7
MFFMKKLRRDILLEPQFLGPRMRELVKARLFEELEGQCLGRLGYIISILDIDDSDISAGLIDIDTGSVNISVWYSAILLRPFKNEVLDAVVFSSSDEVSVSRCRKI